MTASLRIYCHDVSLGEICMHYLQAHYSDITITSHAQLAAQSDVEKCIILWQIDEKNTDTLDTFLSAFSHDYPTFIFLGDKVPDAIENVAPSPTYIHQPLPVNLPLLKQAIEHLQHYQRQPIKSISPNWLFDIVHKQLLSNTHNQTILLTQKESDLLFYFLESAGKVIDRNTLLSSIWGYDDSLNTNTLETHIYRLRSKIEPIFGENQGIITDNNGYRFVASIA